MPAKEKLFDVGNWIAGIMLVLALFGGAYSYILDDFNTRKENSRLMGEICALSQANKEAIAKLERKVDGVYSIHAELLSMKSVMSSMDRRLERFESYFFQQAKNSRGK